MKLCTVLLLYLGTLVLPISEGNEHPESKYRERRFLMGNLFGGKDSPSPVTNEVSVLVDSFMNNAENFCQGGCRDGWISYGGQCYMYVPDQMTWEEAERNCRNRAIGGHLTSISSAEHNSFLVSLAISQGQRMTDFWTGGNHQKGYSLRWTDGSMANFIQRPLSSLLQAVGNTINSILNIRICLKLNLSIGGQGNWDGSDCRKKLPFVCSYKPDLTAP